MAVLLTIVAAVVGGTIGAIFATLAKNKLIRVLLIIGPAILSARLATPFIQHALNKGTTTPTSVSQFEALYGSNVRPALMLLPAYERVFNDHPAVETAFKEDLRKAYDASDPSGLNEAAVAIGTRAVADVMIRYVPFARDDDLIEVARTFTDILETLQARDPEVCVLFLHGPAHGKPLSSSQLTQSLGADRFNRLNQASLRLIAGAAQTVVPFDRARGQQLMAEIGKQRAPLLTGRSSEVVTGARLSEGAEEAQAACAFFVAIYQDIAALPSSDSATVLRYIFAST